MRDKQFPGHRLVIALVALAAALFTCATLAAPLLDARQHAAAPLARGLYFPLCHQLTERSLAIHDYPFAVCARCFGLYSGGVLGLLLVAAGLRRPGRRAATWLLVALLPTTIDFLLPRVGLPQLSNLPRMFLAMPGGLVLALHLGWALTDWLETRSAHRSSTQMSTTITTPVLEEANE